MSDKPGVLERLGSALNSSDLSPVHGRIGAVELITALAYTQTNPDAAEHDRLEAAEIDPRTELGSDLVRLKYAGDRTLGDRAVLRLEHWVRHQRAFRNWRVKPGSKILQSFVRQGLAEWLFPVCQVCHGGELHAADKGEIVERRVRCQQCGTKGYVLLKSPLNRAGVRRDCTMCVGSGWRTLRRVRRSKPKECYSCQGAGRAPASEAGRAGALGIEHRVYQRHWAKRFDWLSRALDRLNKLERLCLQSQFVDAIRTPEG